jgi:hypothetical protein
MYYQYRSLAGGQQALSTKTPYHPIKQAAVRPVFFYFLKKKFAGIPGYLHPAPGC